MKVVITGGAGYVGTELIRMLSHDNTISEIVIYDNLSRKNYNLFLSEKMIGGHISFVYGDILDSRKLKETIANADVVYHLAAKVSTPFANEDPHLFEQVNHWGTAELSYALEESRVKTLIYLSSISVYGARQEQVNEDTIPNPKTYYGISKLNGEKMISRLGDKINTYILRCGNVYGYSKSMRFDAVVNKFMFEAHFNKKISIQGSGKQQRAFIHIARVSTVLAGIIHYEGIKSGTYNLVDRNLSVIELANTIKSLYPDLEMIFVQQDLSLKNVIVDTETKLSTDCLSSTKTKLLEDLQAFKSHFSFIPGSMQEVQENTMI
ncbi:MAG TPA: SDR family oxidoreductase [Flavobacteriales bacterium]|nr:SDR family oxidoreductase [Flavobacteriales bacterium]